RGCGGGLRKTGTCRVSVSDPAGGLPFDDRWRESRLFHGESRRLYQSSSPETIAWRRVLGDSSSSGTEGRCCISGMATCDASMATGWAPSSVADASACGTCEVRSSSEPGEGGSIDEAR